VLTVDAYSITLKVIKRHIDPDSLKNFQLIVNFTGLEVSQYHDPWFPLFLVSIYKKEFVHDSVTAWISFAFLPPNFLKTFPNFVRILENSRKWVTENFLIYFQIRDEENLEIRKITTFAWGIILTLHAIYFKRLHLW